MKSHVRIVLGPAKIGTLCEHEPSELYAGGWSGLATNPFRLFSADAWSTFLRRCKPKTAKKAGWPDNTHLFLNLVLHSGPRAADLASAAKLAVLDADALALCASDSIVVCTARVVMVREIMLALEMRSPDCSLLSLSATAVAPLDKPAKKASRQVARSGLVASGSLSVSNEHMLRLSSSDAQAIVGEECVDAQSLVALTTNNGAARSREFVNSIFRDRPAHLDALADELARAQLAEPPAEEAESDQEEEEEQVQPDAEEHVDEDLEFIDADIELEQEEPPPLPIEHRMSLPQADHVEWLRRAVRTDTCKIAVDFHGPFTRDELRTVGNQMRLVRSTSSTPSALEEQLCDGIDPEADSVYALVVSLTRLQHVRQREKEVVVAAPQRPAESVVERAPDEREKEESEVDADDEEAQAAVAAEPSGPVVVDWLDYFAALDFSSLRIYELEKYAKRRLEVHIALLTEQEDDVCVTTYPRRSGASKELLRLLGDDVLDREDMHEAIALGVLCVVAHGSDRLRNALLCGEIMLLNRSAKSSQSVIEVSGILLPNDEADEAEVLQHCEMIESFWKRLDGKPSLGTDSDVGRLLRDLHESWERVYELFLKKELESESDSE